MTHFALTALMSMGFLLLAGCGGTKVYTANKTIVYGGSLYNMGNVQRITSRVEGQLPDGSTVDMRTLDKKGVQKLLDDHDSLVVSAVFEFDDLELLYQRGEVDKYSEYNRIVKRSDGALKDINKFMADKKKTQLDLE